MTRAVSLTDEQLATIRVALYNVRSDLRDMMIRSGLADATTPELIRIDAALAALEAQEVQPSPDWSQAPEWAMWWAMDESGNAFWFENRPMRGSHCFMQDEARWVQSHRTFGVDWRTTLRKRPAP